MKKKDSGCACGPERAVVLYVSLSRDELPCAKCGREIPVDSIRLSGDLTQKLRRWVDQRYALELLWFASGEYESLAKNELDGSKSKINRLGAELAAAMPAWLWVSPHAAAEQYVDRYLDPCPLCNGITEESGFGGRFGRSCAKCRVIGPGEEG